MNLQQFDDVLNSWKARLSAIAENLMELQSDSTYQSLTGTGGLEKVVVEGETGAAVENALRTMNGLFLRFGLLQSTIDRAAEIRSGLPSLFGSEAKLQAMYQLLFTRSIDLEINEVPLAERHLLSGTQHAQKVTPEELLASMTQTFSQVRDTVAAVGQAWAEYGACAERVDAEVARFRTQAAMPSRLLAPALQALEASILETAALAKSDPAGAVRRLRTQVEPTLASVSQRIAAAEQVSRQLGAARSRWLLLDEVHREAVAVVAEVQARLTAEHCPAGLMPEAKLHALGEWLERLDRKRDEGALQAVTVGLRNWSAAAESCMAQDKKVLSECEARLAARGELRGRLDALTAKARARGVADEHSLAGLRCSAEDLLSARPMDLGLAREAVARFEHRLRTPNPAMPEAARVAGSR